MTVSVGDLRDTISRHIEDARVEEFGVFVHHVQSGDTIQFNPDALYPLASVFKIPILIETLAQVDAGECSLSERIELRPDHRLAPSGVLVELDSGLSPTLRDLLTLMIIVSDNTATDMVFDRIGRHRVDERLRAWNVNDVHIHLGVTELFRTALTAEGDAEDFVDTFRRLAAAGPIIDPITGLPPSEVEATFSRTPDWTSLPSRRSPENNVASPAGMGNLLLRLLKSELLSPSSTRVALDILLRQQLNQRIPRFLPHGTQAAHKTGTFLQSRNDAGILYLPNGERLIVVTFALLRRDLLQADMLEAAPYIDAVDGAMGKIARSAYDAFSHASSA